MHAVRQLDMQFIVINLIREWKTWAAVDLQYFTLHRVQKPTISNIFHLSVGDFLRQAIYPLFSLDSRSKFMLVGIFLSHGMLGASAPMAASSASRRITLLRRIQFRVHLFTYWLWLGHPRIFLVL